MTGAAWTAALGDIAAAVHRGDVSAVELVTATLVAVDGGDRGLNALVTVDRAGAVAAAQAVDDAVREGRRPALAGVPFAVKESEPVMGWRSTSGDPHRAHAPPSQRDSLAVARLRAAGAIPVAAANLALYGGWAETSNPLYGATVNPWDRSRVPGGSSGGSAAAVSAGLVAFATGSDGGGSIRTPAAACGVVGLKATPGVIPIHDGRPAAWGTLAVRGPIARTVRDLALLLDVVAGADPTDPGSLVLPGSFIEARKPPLRGLRVAWSSTLGYAAADPRITACCALAVGALEAAGAVVHPLDTVFDAEPGEAFAVPFVQAIAAEVRSARGSGSVGDLGAELESWLQRAAGLSAAEVEEAARLRRHLCDQLDGVFAVVDVLACPTVAELPPRSPHPGAGWVQFTHPFNLAGVPALSLPVGTVVDHGVTLPVGLQLVGHPGDDHALVAVAEQLEEILGLSLRPPTAGDGRSENR